MKEEYSINEILKAIDELQNIKREKKRTTITKDTHILRKKTDIPSNTLKLIEEAEQTIRVKI